MLLKKKFFFQRGNSLWTFPAAKSKILDHPPLSDAILHKGPGAGRLTPPEVLDLWVLQSGGHALSESEAL